MMPILMPKRRYPGDLYFSSVSFLSHCDGTNGSTTLTDSSKNAWVSTANGNAQLSTSSPKYGTASALFDGSGDYFSLNSSAASALFQHGSADWTYECFFKVTGGSGTFQDFMGKRAETVVLQLRSDDKLAGAFYWGASNADLISGFGSTLIDSTWHHGAFVRDVNTLRLYLDGTQLGTVSCAGHTCTDGTSTNFAIGAKGDAGNPMTGNLDEVRVTKGVCRYPNGTSFTPPTAAFPNY